MSSCLESDSFTISVRPLELRRVDTAGDASDTRRRREQHRRFETCPNKQTTQVTASGKQAGLLEGYYLIYSRTLEQLSRVQMC